MATFSLDAPPPGPSPPLMSPTSASSELPPPMFGVHEMVALRGAAAVGAVPNELSSGMGGVAAQQASETRNPLGGFASSEVPPIHTDAPPLEPQFDARDEEAALEPPSPLVRDDGSEDFLEDRDMHSSIKAKAPTSLVVGTCFVAVLAFILSATSVATASWATKAEANGEGARQWGLWEECTVESSQRDSKMPWTSKWSGCGAAGDLEPPYRITICNSVYGDVERLKEVTIFNWENGKSTSCTRMPLYAKGTTPTPAPTYLGNAQFAYDVEMLSMGGKVQTGSGFAGAMAVGACGLQALTMVLTLLELTGTLVRKRLVQAGDHHWSQDLLRTYSIPACCGLGFVCETIAILIWAFSPGRFYYGSGATVGYGYTLACIVLVLDIALAAMVAMRVEITIQAKKNAMRLDHLYNRINHHDNHHGITTTDGLDRHGKQRK